MAAEVHPKTPNSHKGRRIGKLDEEVTKRNIAAISEIERQALASRNFTARLGDFIATQAGRMWFIMFHAAWFTGWICYNRWAGPNRDFDPYPFPLLTMIVSLESIFLSLFLLMSQTRSNAHAEQRNHLDLQINLLSEHENTKMLQMLEALCNHHKVPIGDQEEIRELVARTEPSKLLDNLKKNLPSAE